MIATVMTDHVPPLTIVRPDVSGYQAPDFRQQELKAFQRHFPHISYHTEGDIPAGKIIWITNSNSNPNSILPYRDQVELIIHPNSGYDNFNLDFLKSVDCPIVLGNTIRAQAVTEYILSQVFAQGTPVPLSKNWDTNRRFSRRLLEEKKATIFGAGLIGQKLYDVLKPLVRNCQIIDPYQSLTAIFPVHESQILILACSANCKNRHMINKAFLSQMRSDYHLINAARGSLVLLHDLLADLGQRPHSFASIDVFENEPVNFKDLPHLSNIRYTSHIAGVFDQIDEHIIDFEVSIISDFLAGQLFQNNDSRHFLHNRIVDETLI